MIYTFYSFKGGVGRSMALSNVAEFLCSRGARVLMIDWDLEAPGLESFFFAPDDAGSLDIRSRVGLIDYLDQYRRDYDALRPRAKFIDVVQGLRPLERLLAPIHPPVPNNPTGGELWLLPAGWRASRKAAKEGERLFDDRFPKYAATVQDFSWSEFYTAYEGETFFNWFRERLLKGPPGDDGTSGDGSRRGFDVVLIDSRTGVTEVGGVCTRQLADVVVSFCAPNYQNLAGAERMSESFSQPKIMEARGNRPLEVVVIPARVDEAGETDAQNTFRREFIKKVKTPAALKESITSSWQLLVPYVTKYAYQESLAIAAADSNEKLEQAYKKLTAHLVLLAPLDSRIRVCLSAEIQALRRSRPRSFLLLADSGADAGADLAIRNAGIELAANISEAGSILVSFRQATLTAEVKQHIRNARQRGACVYGLRKGGAAAGVPALLRKSTIYESGQPLDELFDQLRVPCQARLAPFMCPTLTPGWVPRKEALSQLKSFFLNVESSASKPVVAIRGPAGFGATTLAAGLCYDESILDLFIDGILWVTPGGAGDVLGCLNAIGTALSGSSLKFESISEATARLTQQLAGATCLLVVDEVVREEDLNPFRTIPVALLTTVRQSVPIKDATEVTLDRMSHAEAVEAIVTGRPEAVKGRAFPTLAYRLGHWPLALALAKTPIAQLTSKGVDAEAAAASLAKDLERGDFSAFGTLADSLLREARQQVTDAVRSLSEADRDVFHSLKSLLDTPSFPLDSFPGRWTFGEERFRAVLETLQRAGLIALDAELGTVELPAFTIQYLRELRTVPESQTSVFVLQPFGAGFDLPDRDLIAPGLHELGIRGRTTGNLLEAGNVRSDHLQSLLTADLVIADISVADWNVFYQLGIRHALRDKRTLLIRATNIAGPAFPFDLKTDRYVSYDARNPAQSLNSFISAVKGALDSDITDSPLFRALPNLISVSPEQITAAPPEFHEDVTAAERERSTSNLRLFSEEVRTLPWALVGLRMAGRAQSRLGSYRGAAETWEQVRRTNAGDKEANLALGTIYQRLNDLAASDEALQRVSRRPDLSEAEGAEVFALRGRNSKARWREEWQGRENAGNIALISPLLRESIQQYSLAFQRDPHSYYAGLNALSLLAIQCELAKSRAKAWEDQFETEEEARAEVSRLERERSLFAAAVELALREAGNKNQEDFWFQLSRADWTLYTAVKTPRVVAAYRHALSGVPPFAVESARSQLMVLRDLGVMRESVQSVLEVFPPSTNRFDSGGETAAPRTAILFAGHTLDGPTRKEPRFPKDSEAEVRRRILEAVMAVKAGSPNMIGICGASAGADILFHEVCLEAGVPTVVCLPYPPEDFVSSSVQYAGSEWLGRFFSLLKNLPLRILANSAELPSWLGSQPRYSVWQRNLHWMLASGMEEGNAGLRLMALWDGRDRPGYGGVSDFVHQAQARGLHTDIVSMPDTDKSGAA